MKKNIKRVISFVCIAAVVALLAAMPMLAKQENKEDGPQASILSNTVATGSISTELIGGGTLTEEDAVTITVPEAVKLTRFLVSDGQIVTEGTPVAEVDRVTVMTAITQVQETLEYLAERIEDERRTDTTEKVNALAGGIVKAIYAETGESVQSVMLDHGALAVLSLDGLMAVDLEAASDLTAGSAVNIKFYDGTVVSGRIEKNLAGQMTVTLEDKGYDIGAAVQVIAGDGTSLGVGELYIYSPWNATAYTGTVGRIYVQEGEKLAAGKTLMLLEDVLYSASYQQLISQRQEYEELMMDLFKMYQTETVTAPCDGVVSGIDEASAQLLSVNGEGFILSFLANAPNGNDQAFYANYVGKVTAVTETGWSLLVNPQPISITDYMDLSGVPLEESAMTMTCTYPDVPAQAPEEPAPTEPEEAAPPEPEETAPAEETDPSRNPPLSTPEAPEDAGEIPGAMPEAPQLNTVPVYELADGVWQQIGFSSVQVGDILLFAADQNGDFVWIVRISRVSQKPGTPSNPGGNFPGGGFPTGGMGSYMQSPEPEFSLYSLELVQIAAVTPQDTMTLEIVIDELDIKALEIGMTAQVKIGALGGEKFTAAITEIGNTGTGNGGNSKYTVELTMAREGDMLSGMNATVTIVLGTAGDILTIPAAALVEQGNETVVYTGYDPETETLLNPVTVVTGCSDGETVQILEGLTLGQTYYYAYYDTLEISNAPDFGRGSPFG